MPSGTKLNSYFDKALTFVKKSSNIMIDGFYERKQVSSKTADWDLVTESDKEVESSLIQQFKKEFPDHKFVAEESQSGAKLSSDPTWIIDPIDGTMNFVHTYPQCCMSVALAIDKKLVIGIVYNPITDQLFSAMKGEGAFLNGKPIKASKTEEVSKSLLALEMLRARQTESHHDHMVNVFGLCLSKSHGVRIIGSAALSLCYVAMGCIDAYYAKYYLSSYDIAAGVLILSEAGGTALSTDGTELDLMEPKFIAASTSTLANNLVHLLKHL